LASRPHPCQYYQRKRPESGIADIGVSEDERRKLFANAMRRDLKLRDSPYRTWQAHKQHTKRLRRKMQASSGISDVEKLIPLFGI
jgi:hypothetical protein